MAEIIKGSQLMLFLNGASIAHATNHTLTMNTETTEVNSKDYGIFSASTPNRVTWELASENLYTEGAFTSLRGTMLNMTPVTAYFGTAANWDPKGLGSAESWAQDSSYALSYGQGYITSLSVNADASDNASMSITITGSGDLKTV